MAWTAPRTMAVGTTGTSADWNTYVRDNENWLRTGMTQTQPGRLINTSYQNTTDGIVIANGQITGVGGSYVNVKCGSTATPSTGGIVIGTFGMGGPTTTSFQWPIMFAVPNAFYYIVEVNTGTAGLSQLTEYRL